MNSEERELISRFFARVGGGEGGAQTAQSNLPAIDPEADRFIAENFQRYPEARYRVTQVAVVQEAALAQAQNRIRELEMQLQQARSQQQAQAGQSSGGFFSNMFGRSNQPQQPSQQPRTSALPPGWGPAPGAGSPGVAGSYASAPGGVQPGMFGRSGSGFLGSALTTAAGVAGGMMAADALEGLFSGHHEHGGDGATGGGFADGQGDTFITNNYGDTFGGPASGAPSDDPFGGSGTEAGGFTPQDFGGQDFGEQDPPAPEDTGSDMGGFDDGGGFDDNSF